MNEDQYEEDYCEHNNLYTFVEDYLDSNDEWMSCRHFVCPDCGHEWYEY